MTLQDAITRMKSYGLRQTCLVEALRHGLDVMNLSPNQTRPFTIMCKFEQKISAGIREQNRMQNLKHVQLNCLFDYLFAET